MGMSRTGFRRGMAKLQRRGMSKSAAYNRMKAAARGSKISSFRTSRRLGSNERANYAFRRMF